MSIEALAAKFEQHDREDKERFDRMFTTVEQIGKGVAVLNQRQDRQDRDNQAIITEVQGLRTDIVNSRVQVAEQKGSFDSFKVPVIGLIMAIIGGGVAIWYKG